MRSFASVKIKLPDNWLLGKRPKNCFNFLNGHNQGLSYIDSRGGSRIFSRGGGGIFKKSLKFFENFVDLFFKSAELIFRALPKHGLILKKSKKGVFRHFLKKL